MTSHQYSANKAAAKYDIKTSLKSIIAPSVITFLLSVYCFIVSPLRELSIYTNSSGQLNLKEIRSIYALLLTYTNGSNMGWLFMLAGGLFALFSFRFIMKKKAVNVFLSAPIDRRTLYKNRALLSCGLLAAAIFLPIVLDFIINVYVFGHFAYVLECALLLFAECFIYALTGFAVTAVAMSFCNTVVESIFFGTTVIFAPTAAVYFINALCSAFLNGYNHAGFVVSYSSYYDSYYYYGASVFAGPSLLNYTSIINPLLLGKAYGTQYNTTDNIINFVCRNAAGIYNSDDYSSPLYSGYEDISFAYIIPLIVWLAISICLLFVAKKLFVKLKAENAGVRGTKPFAQKLFAAELAIVSFALWIGVGASGYTDYAVPNTSTTLFIAVIGIIILLAVYFIVLSICRRTVKHKAKELITPVTAAAAAVVLIAVFSGGLFGYSTYVPEPDDVVCAAITSAETDLTSGEIPCEPYEDSFYGSVFNTSGNRTVGLFTDKEDIKALTDINKSLVEKTDNMTGNSVSVCYELKNGKTVRRYYKQTDFDASYSILSLRDSKASREELEYLLTGDPKEEPITKKLANSALSTDEIFSYETEKNIAQMFRKGTLYVVNSDNITNYKTIKNTPEFRQALAEDLLNQTYEQRFKPEESAIGGVFFSMYGDTDGISSTYYCDYETGYYIYPSMKNTVNYLKSTGEYKLFGVDKAIESVSVESCKNIRESQYADEGYPTSYLFTGTNQNFYSPDNFYDDYYYDDEPYTMSDYFKKGKTFEDADEIKELADKGRIFFFADKDDYIIMIKYKDKSCVTKLIPAEEIPDRAK